MSPAGTGQLLTGPWTVRDIPLALRVLELKDPDRACGAAASRAFAGRPTVVLKTAALTGTVAEGITQPCPS